jgi:ribose transport system permease protein
MTAATSRYDADRLPVARRAVRALSTPGGAIYLLLGVLLVLLFLYNPSLGESGQFMRFVGRTAPIAIVALGQYFVIVSGELDLSMGAVISAQVVLAGNVIGQHADRVLPVMVLMLVVGIVIGILNGILTTLFRVPSFIATLGTTLVVSGVTFYWTGGAPSGNPIDSFRAIGRAGIDNVPLLGFVPYSVIILVVLVGAAIWLMRRPFGRLLLSVGDNQAATALTGASVWWLRTRAFILSSIASTIAAVILVGYAGVSPVVGQGYEFIAITAVVLGGAVLGGGRGWVLSAIAAAFALEVLFSLLDFVGVQSTWRPAVQGVIIVVALGAPLLRWHRSRRNPETTVVPSPSPGESAGD